MTELPQPGSFIGGRYRIESLLGKGGMGAVFAAVNTATGRAVAIKWMLPKAADSAESLARFMAEARTTARIEHPNVIGVLDAGEDHGAPFLVMERLRGESLRQRLKRGRLGPDEALDVLIHACRGVAEAHAEGVIHRDLKPDNIFVCIGKDGSSRETKVLDFGISKLYEEQNARKLTQTGMAIGTPAYMAPEQLNSPKDIDVRADVYAMGVVLYQTLTGRRPYDADSAYEIIYQASRGNPTPISSLAPDVPPELDAIVMRAMQVNREHRHANMRELVRDLEAVRARMQSSPASRTGPISYAPPVAAMAPISTPSPLSSSAYSHPPTHVVSHAPPTHVISQAPIYSAPHPAQSTGPMQDWYYAPHSAPAAPYQGRPPQRTASILLAAIVGAIAAVVLIGGGVGVALFALRPESDRGPSAQASAGGSSAPRPRVELSFAGGCRPRWDGTIALVRTGAYITMNARLGNDVLARFQFSAGNLQFPAVVQLSTAQYMSSMMILMMGEGPARSWYNYKQDASLTPATDSVSGTLTVRTYDLERGVLDISFQNVTLQEANGSTVCQINGRLQTFGYTWGD